MGKFKFGALTILIPLVLLALLAACVQPAPMPVVQSRGLTYLSELQVAGETELNGAVTINNDVEVSGTLTLDGAPTINNDVEITGTLDVDGATTINNDAEITGTLGVEGAADLASVDIGGGFGDAGCSVSDAGVLQCDGAATLGSTLVVTGTSDLMGNLADSGGVLTIADDAAVTGTLTVGGNAAMVSSLVTNGVGITNSVTGASNAVVFEGPTADAYQINLIAADATSSDKNITLPNLQGEVMVSNGWDASQGWWFSGQDLKHEGVTADGNEFVFRAPANPGATVVLSAPDFSGYIATNSAALKTIYGSDTITGTLAVTHGLTTPLYAFCSMGADPVDNEEDRCTVLISSSTVTVKVWKEATSPTAGDSGVTVYWSVVGTP